MRFPTTDKMRDLKTKNFLVVLFVAIGLCSFALRMEPVAWGQATKDLPHQDNQMISIQQKLDQIQELSLQLVAAGGNQDTIAPLGQQVFAYIKAGKLKEAEDLLDKILAIVTSSIKSLKNPSPVATQPKPIVQPGTFITKPKSIELGKLLSDAAIIFWSVRYEANRPDRLSFGPSELYVMNKEGGNVTQITFNHPQHYEHAAVSFDRKMIACNRNRYKDGSSSGAIWIIDLEKKTEAQLVPDFTSVGSIDWSPDGWIYFGGQPQGAKRWDIFKIRPDGTELTQLTFVVPSEPGGEGDISVSEDGSLVAYNRTVAKIVGKTIVGKPQIWVMNADGTNQHMVYDGGSELGMDPSGPIGAYDPEISPDNQSVIFSQVNTQHKNFKDGINTAHDLWIAPLDPSAPAKRLTQEGPVSIVPDWHDGKIIYTEYNEKDHYVGLVMMNPDGSGKKPLEPKLKKLWDGGRHGKFIPR